jgi:hypothetical protein
MLTVMYSAVLAQAPWVSVSVRGPSLMVTLAGPQKVLSIPPGTLLAPAVQEPARALPAPLSQTAAASTSMAAGATADARALSVIVDPPGSLDRLRCGDAR